MIKSIYIYSLVFVHPVSIQQYILLLPINCMKKLYLRHLRQTIFLNMLIYYIFPVIIYLSHTQLHHIELN